jgi:myo-inositol-1(or 4)-monophosphatase
VSDTFDHIQLDDFDRALLAAAINATRAGGAELLKRFRAPAAGEREKTSSVDLVSDADLASDTAIATVLRTHRPNDVILSEESGGDIAADGAIGWIVDPLDGTHNYLRGIPLWCVSIAACDDDGARVGVVSDPVHEEIFVAVRGSGVWLNGVVLGPRRATTKVGAMILGGSCRRAVAAEDPRYRRLDKFVAGFGSTRELIAAALELAWTAVGRIDVLYHESKIEVWDKAAGSLLCSEAGLAVRDLPAALDGSRPRLLICPVEVLNGLLDQIR